MQISLTDKNLSPDEKEAILDLLNREDTTLPNDLKQMWYLMDLIWDDFDCDNKELNWDKIGKFYSHPVWLLNGLFIEQDEESMQHRHAISDWIITNNFQNAVDYGGGFGTLARLIAEKKPTISMHIYEPHPSEFGLKRVRDYSNIKIIDKLDKNYDCLLSTDVLEHVPDPLKDFSEMIKSVKKDGYLIIANAFFPMIKCHLPQNFHFRYTFDIFARMMGLQRIGILEGSHATIFKKVAEKKVNWPLIRAFEIVSKIAFSIIENSKMLLRPLKRFLRR